MIWGKEARRGIFSNPSARNGANLQRMQHFLVGSPSKTLSAERWGREVEERGAKQSVRLEPDKLKDARKNANFSQVKLAERSGVPQITVYRAERGTRISKSSAQYMAQALGVTLDELLAPPDEFILPLGKRLVRKDENTWVEYHDDSIYATFTVFDQGKDFIRLQCTRRRRKRAHGIIVSMLIEIRYKERQVYWSWEDPLNWRAFNIVKEGKPE